jgi:putative SOS response-associated peptidase YedK
MCGRYASARKRQDLLEEFRIDRDRVIDDLDPDYNVAPTKPVYAVLTRAERGRARSAGAGETERARAGESAGAGETGREQPGAGDGAAQGVARELRVVRWGLVPSWAKDPAIGSRMINARVETVDAKPSFRSAFAKRRCLLPADGFYEWLKVDGDSAGLDPAAPPKGKPRKQPYYIHRADGGVLAFAGLYELWRDKSAPDDHPQAWLWTTVIITTQAEDEVGRLHDRMPMVIDPARWEDWLDPANNDAQHVHTLLAPAAASGLASYPVGTEVNYVRNNGPGLIKPLSPDTGGDGRGGGRADRGPRSGPTGGQPAPALAADRPARTEDRYRRSASAPLSLF